MAQIVRSVPNDLRTGMAAQPNIRLDLSNRPENVVLVRETLTGVAETIGLDVGDLNDIRTAVTEACNNVVLHAYEGGEGPLEVEVYVTASALEVIVRDRGIGLLAPADADQWTAGIGLPVIEALVRHVGFTDTSGGGTEVRMDFATPSAHELESLGEDGLGEVVILPDERAATTTVTIAPIDPLARTVLPRLLGVLAARANFSTDRISDALLVADALVAHAPASTSASHLSVVVNVAPRKLELRLGPLDPGCAQRLISDSDVEGVGRVIEKLTDEHGVAQSGSREELNLRLTDRR
jgi:serine/threonine-protein kinase RsbW